MQHVDVSRAAAASPACVASSHVPVVPVKQGGVRTTQFCSVDTKDRGVWRATGICPGPLLFILYTASNNDVI